MGFCPLSEDFEHYIYSMKLCSRYKREFRKFLMKLMASYNYRCGACKLLRRKCVQECIFAPHFNNDEGAEQFASIHKIFGAKNFSKFLSELHPNDHDVAVKSILYEAQARLDDPTLGCVRKILDLQRQVELLQAQVAYLQSLQAAQNNTNDNIPSEGGVGVEGHMDFDEQQIDELYEKLFGSSS